MQVRSQSVNKKDLSNSLASSLWLNQEQCILTNALPNMNYVWVIVNQFMFKNQILNYCDKVFVENNWNCHKKSVHKLTFKFLIWSCKFSLLFLPTSTSYDYVEVYDGESARDVLLGKYCGTTKPQTITSTSEMLFVRFMTDSSIERLGFSANYSTGQYNRTTLVNNQGKSICIIKTSLKYIKICLQRFCGF